MTEVETTAKPHPRIERTARLRWIPLGQMQVNDTAQRELKTYRVDHLVAHFDHEKIGNPVVNERGGRFFVIDGQHRCAAAKEVYGDLHEIQCWTYVGLTQEQEAEMFLKLNDVLTVAALDKYRVSVEAGRDIEADIDRIVRSLGLVVTAQKVEGGIGAVGTLRRVYVRSGARVFSRTLRILNEAFGTAGLEAHVIDGIGLLCGRYNGELQDELVVTKLGNMRGGVKGLMGKAAVIKERVRQPYNQCIAAAVVEILNAGKGGAKLASWWREDAA